METEEQMTVLRAHLKTRENDLAQAQAQVVKSGRESVYIYICVCVCECVFDL